MRVRDDRDAREYEQMAFQVLYEPYFVGMQLICTLDVLLSAAAVPGENAEIKLFEFKGRVTHTVPNSADANDTTPMGFFTRAFDPPPGFDTKKPMTLVVNGFF